MFHVQWRVMWQHCTYKMELPKLTTIVILRPQWNDYKIVNNTVVFARVLGVIKEQCGRSKLQCILVVLSTRKHP